MNKKNIFSLLLGAMLILFAACEPIEDRKELSNSFNPDNIELEVVQSTPGGNGLSIRMKTPGVTGYWDYNIDKRFTDRVDVNYPIPGKSTFTYHVSTAYMPNGTPSETEYISKSIDVQIDVLDQPLPQAYYDLVGDDLGGKTWVFDGGTSTPEQGGMWWFMSPLGEPDNYMTAWWNAGGTCCPPVDAEGKMRFDLDGGANYTYYANATAEGVTGSSFKFNIDYTKFSIVGDASILGDQDGAATPDKTWVIQELSADRLVLWQDNMPYTSAWTWVFVPEAD